MLAELNPIRCKLRPNRDFSLPLLSDAGSCRLDSLWQLASKVPWCGNDVDQPCNGAQARPPQFEHPQTFQPPILPGVPGHRNLLLSRLLISTFNFPPKHTLDLLENGARILFLEERQEDCPRSASGGFKVTGYQ